MSDYITKRAGYWHFQRRVPTEFSTLDDRVTVRHSTKVAVAKDHRGVKAGKVADAMNRELEAYWRGLSQGKAQEAADRYKEARRRARTFGFDYVETEELANQSALEVLKRVEKLLTAGRVENVTRLAVQPILPGLVKNLVGLAYAYAEANDVKITTVGTNSTKTASFYTDLESGKTSCTLRKYDLLTKWFEENWPEGHTMPKLEDPQHYPSH